MPEFTVQVRLQDFKKLETDSLVVGFFENIRPLKNLAGELDWLLCGSLSNLIINHKLRGSVGDVALLTSRGKIPPQKIFMVGLGPKENVSPTSLSKAVRTAVASVVNAGAKNAALEFPVSDMAYDISVPAVLRGIAEAAAGKRIGITLLAPDAGGFESISKLAGENSISA
jgi:hypothetical protein